MGSKWDLLRNRVRQRTWGPGAAGTELQAPTGPPGGAPPPLEADAAGKAPALASGRPGGLGADGLSESADPANSAQGAVQQNPAKRATGTREPNQAKCAIEESAPSRPTRRDDAVHRVHWHGAAVRLLDVLHNICAGQSSHVRTPGWPPSRKRPSGHGTAAPSWPSSPASEHALGLASGACPAGGAAGGRDGWPRGRGSASQSEQLR